MLEFYPWSPSCGIVVKLHQQHQRTTGHWFVACVLAALLLFQLPVNASEKPSEDSSSVLGCCNVGGRHEKSSMLQTVVANWGGSQWMEVLSSCVSAALSNK